MLCATKEAEETRAKLQNNNGSPDKLHLNTQKGLKSPRFLSIANRPVEHDSTTARLLGMIRPGTCILNPNSPSKHTPTGHHLEADIVPFIPKGIPFLLWKLSGPSSVSFWSLSLSGTAHCPAHNGCSSTAHALGSAGTATNSRSGVQRPSKALTIRYESPVSSPDNTPAVSPDSTP
jgi:hypothetical protein